MELEKEGARIRREEGREGGRNEETGVKEFDKKSKIIIRNYKNGKQTQTIIYENIRSFPHPLVFHLSSVWL